jgi:hypothetical protein
MSAGVTGISSLAEGLAQYNAGRQRKALFDTNAEIAARQAQSEAQAGAYNEMMVRMRGDALAGQQTAQIGASNLQQAGTPAQVVASSRMVNEMDALQVRNNANRRAWGYRVQGVSDELQGKMAADAGLLNGVGSILTGGAAAYKQRRDTGSWF